MLKTSTPPRKFRAVITNVLCLLLASAPLLALSGNARALSAQAQDGKDKDPKLKTSSGEAVLRTFEPPLKDAPSVDEMKRKGDNPELKKGPKPKERLPESVRCRPGDKICQDAWKAKGQPSSNIGQVTPPVNNTQRHLLDNLVARLLPDANSPFNWLQNVTELPLGFGAFARKNVSSVAMPLMMQAAGVTLGDWQTEMTQGRNRMGGTDLFSGNYSWGVPIVGLPGRSGHDLGLSLSYNSHIWVKTLTNGTMKMTDYAEWLGDPGTGFRVGLPFLRALPHTSRTSLTSYLLILPGGNAVELIRRGGTTASQIYEAVDGSLLHLLVEGGNQYLYFPNGTRLRFQNFACTEIRDRNGNQITATYVPGTSSLQTLTDTLGRQINFYYDAYYQITDIKQTRKDASNADVIVTLAHFGYQDISIRTNFASASQVANGTILPVLKNALLADGSLYTFDYTSYGQVKKIAHYAPLNATPSVNNLCGAGSNTGCDYRLLNYTTYNLPSTNDGTNAQQTDCPRFTSRFDWAADWNGGVTTSYTPPSSANGFGWGQATTPDGTTTREYYLQATNNAESWKDGLSYKMEAYESGQTPGTSTPKKTTLTTWEQAASGTNWGPRVANTTVTDGENNSSRYSEVYYDQGYNLPTAVYAFKGTNGSGTMLSYSNTSYLLTNSYIRTNAYYPSTNLHRWIVGLPDTRYSYQPNNAAGTSFTTLGKVTYQYDQSGAVTQQMPASGAISNHDNTNFSSAFVVGRGNVTSVTKWDATDEANSAKAITTTTNYNQTGAPILQSLPNNNLTGRSTTISYTDDFSDTATVSNTLAYPTTVTDPDGYTAKMRYRYDIGAVTRTQDPKMIAADPTKGIMTTYDAIGRVTRVDNQFSNGYTRYTYDTAFYWINTYTKADDAGNEFYSAKIFDGYGRARAGISSHPGSVGGLRAQWSVFDAMGRVVQSSNPTEINGSWAPTGDDSGGYIWSQQSYDWKGRPKITTNQDGSTKQYDYGGCGCTGEATVTVTDEVGRKTRQISDAFLDNTMQVNKTEVLAMDGVTVYATTATVQKPLERKSYVIQAAGPTTDYSACAAGNCNSATRQQTTTTYNGLGQVSQRQLPQQSGTTLYSAYTYYADGSLQTSTDARGASATLYYNKRGQTTNINYGTAPSGVEATANVSYSYDANGNRLTMTDGVGTMTYSYDTLSRLLSETRNFTGLSGNFALSYEYYQSTGQLKKITDPFGASISYAYDLAGRTTGVTDNSATPFAGVTNYVTGLSYRAWDGTKALNGTTTLSYDSAMRVTRYQFGAGLDANYTYYADSQLATVSNTTNHVLDRSFNYYDPKGRMSYTNANGVTGAQQYYQNLSFDAFDHISNRNGMYWWMATGSTFTSTSTYTNNKIATGTESGQTVTANYDVQGNLLNTTQGTTTTATIYYDVIGRSTREGAASQTRFYDGNGKIVRDFIDSEQITRFYLWSSVLGDVITALDNTGAKLETSVYAKGQLVAKQQLIQNTPSVKYFRRDPHNTIDTTDSDTKWVDPMNVTGKAADATYINQYQQGVYGHPDPSYYTSNSGMFYPGGSGNPKPGQTKVCELNGAIKDCSYVQQQISNGQVKIESIPAAGPLTDSMIKNGVTVGGLGYSASYMKSDNHVRIVGEEWDKNAKGEDQYWWDITVTLPGGSDLQDPVKLPDVKKLPGLVTSPPKWNLGRNPCTFNININVMGTQISGGEVEDIKNVIWDIFRDAGQFITFDNPQSATNTRRGDFDISIRPNILMPAVVRGDFGIPGTLGAVPTIVFPIGNGLRVIRRNTLGRLTGYISVENARALYSGGEFINEMGKAVAHEDGHYLFGAYLGPDGHPQDNSLMASGGPSQYFSAEQAQRLSALCN